MTSDAGQILWIGILPLDPFEVALVWHYVVSLPTLYNSCSVTFIFHCIHTAPTGVVVCECDKVLVSVIASQGGGSPDIGVCLFAKLSGLWPNSNF